MEGIPDFCIYMPGADTALNGSRRQAVRAVTEHTTQGTDSRGLGKTRHHDTPGTFNFLNRDEGIYCFYPAFVRCSHAAGANHAGPGIENEGFTGQPLTPNQVSNLGKLAHWLHDTYGVPLDLYDGPRIAVDGSSFRGFVNHNSVATEPKYQHVDRIPPNEWAAAVGAVPTPILAAPHRKAKPAMQIEYPSGQYNCFLVDTTGTLQQKAVVPGKAWYVSPVPGTTGLYKPGVDVDVIVFQGGLKVSATAADGDHMVLATFAGGKWSVITK